MLTREQFEASYNKLLNFFAEGEHKTELAQAKKDFFSNAGTLDENKPNYPLRMNQFYDWYFLNRPMGSHMVTPLEVALQQKNIRLTDEDVEALNILKNHKHSLFEFIKIKNGKLIVKDLFANKKIEVLADDYVFNLDGSEIFEARYVEYNGEKRFLRGFCFHPETAKKYILAEVKSYQKNSDLVFEDFLLRLNKMRYKFEQYRHISPDMIYTNDNKLNL